MLSVNLHQPLKLPSRVVAAWWPFQKKKCWNMVVAPTQKQNGDSQKLRSKSWGSFCYHWLPKKDAIRWKWHQNGMDVHEFSVGHLTIQLDAKMWAAVACSTTSSSRMIGTLMTNPQTTQRHGAENTLEGSKPPHLLIGGDQFVQTKCPWICRVPCLE